MLHLGQSALPGGGYFMGAKKLLYCENKMLTTTKWTGLSSLTSEQWKSSNIKAGKEDKRETVMNIKHSA